MDSKYLVIALEPRKKLIARGDNLVPYICHRKHEEGNVVTIIFREIALTFSFPYKSNPLLLYEVWKYEKSTKIQSNTL